MKEFEALEEFRKSLDEVTKLMKKITEPSVEEKRDKILEKLLKPTLLDKVKKWMNLK